MGFEGSGSGGAPEIDRQFLKFEISKPGKGKIKAKVTLPSFQQSQFLHFEATADHFLVICS